MPPTSMSDPRVEARLEAARQRLIHDAVAHPLPCRVPDLL
jgi:uncharacterized protein (DUF1778 family)